MLTLFAIIFIVSVTIPVGFALARRYFYIRKFEKAYKHVLVVQGLTELMASVEEVPEAAASLKDLEEISRLLETALRGVHRLPLYAFLFCGLPAVPKFN